MKTINLILWTFLFILSSLVITSCEKEEIVEDPPKFNEAELPLDIPDNVIVYKTNDGKPVVLGDENAFDGAKLLSNEYLEDKGYCKIEFDSKVTSIGNNAFNKCNSLTEITIPDGVTAIGYGAFSDCSSLTEITIPDRVTSIGYYAFSHCSSLTEITIPDGVTSIGYYAFWYCKSLTSITCHAQNPPIIGENAFKDIKTDAKLYVHAGSIQLYMDSDWGKYFSNIETIP